MSQNDALYNAEGRRILKNLIASLDLSRPLLIAGPTASGKSALAMEIAAKTGGPVVNADALQVYADWRVLTARPSKADEAALPHRLYGHVPGDQTYSVGDWLRDVTPLLVGPPPVIVGGTGLNFTALTEGLADIPQIPEEIRSEANSRIAAGGLAALLRDIDPDTASRIDKQNPMRVQRAWEVQKATGRSLGSWQDETPPPALALKNATALVLDAPKEWLSPRIEQRFRMMIDAGALEEALSNEPTWRADLPSAKAIGARELIAYVRGEMTLETAREAATLLTRQYAKRQRTWFKARMKDWRWIATA